MNFPQMPWADSNVCVRCAAQIARERDVPAYCICHDSTLKLIASAAPADPDALEQIKGMGPHKVKLYGSGLLEAVAGARLIIAYRSSFSRGACSPHLQRDARSIRNAVRQAHRLNEFHRNAR